VEEERMLVADEELANAHLDLLVKGRDTKDPRRDLFDLGHL
jgi:hypothetical protein